MTSSATIRTAAIAATAVLFAVAMPSSDAAAGLKLCDRDWASPTDMQKQLSEVEKLPEVHRTQMYVAYQDSKSTTMWTFTLPGLPSHPAVVCRQPINSESSLKIHMDVNCDGDERACDALVQDFRRLNSQMAKEMNKRE